MTPQETALIDELLKKPCWVVDFLPYQVPNGSPGQFFAVEKYYLDKTRVSQLRHKYVDILLKLNCYYDFSVCVAGGKPALKNPPPEAIGKLIMDTSHSSVIFVEPAHTMITVYQDDLYMSVYNPTKELISLITTLSNANGLFFWEPEY